MDDPHRIETHEQLRERMGEPSDVIRAKVEDHLDEFALEFVAHSPFQKTPNEPVTGSAFT